MRFRRFYEDEKIIAKNNCRQIFSRKKNSSKEYEKNQIYHICKIKNRKIMLPLVSEQRIFLDRKPNLATIQGSRHVVNKDIFHYHNNIHGERRICRVLHFYVTNKEVTKHKKV